MHVTVCVTALYYATQQFEEKKPSEGHACRSSCIPTRIQRSSCENLPPNPKTLQEFSTAQVSRRYLLLHWLLSFWLDVLHCTTTPPCIAPHSTLQGTKGHCSAQFFEGLHCSVLQGLLCLRAHSWVVIGDNLVLPCRDALLRAVQVRAEQCIKLQC